MTEIERIMPCNCIPAYKDRGLSAPDCPYCNYGEDIEQYVVKARIEELENMADDASEYYNQKRCERIAQLKQSLTQEE